MKKKQMDMTQGNPVKILIPFMLPILLGNVFQQFYNIADTVIVGQFVGADALAAVGVCGTPYGMFVALNMGLSSGIGIVVSQLFGAKKEDCIKKTVVNAMILIVLSSILTGGVGFLLAPQLLRLLGTPEAVFADALTYMRIIFVSTLGMAVYNCVAGILRATGDSRTPLYFLICSSILNIVLDVVFVTIIPLGVFGVGFATLLGQLLSALAAFLYARKKYSYFAFEKEEIHADKAILKQLLRAGLPLGLQSSTICLSGVVLQGFINRFGETVIAGNTIAVKFDNILNMPVSSLSMALSTYAGQNIGAKKPERIKSGYRTAWLMVFAYSAVMFLIGHTCGSGFVHLFVTDEPEVMVYGIRGIAIYSSGVLWLGMIYINRSILNGAGDTGFALMIGAVEILGRVGFAWLFITVLKIGAEGIWYTAIANWMLTGHVCLFRYLSGVWKKKRLA
ncbi:MAG: MATE family efflux transporter [Lachnospiraceae bacterium]|nr:MATE family efflux transporter [Lachnospiraceae bacterium]